MYSSIVKFRLRPPGVLLAATVMWTGAACRRSHTITTSDGTLSYQDKGKGAGTITVTGKDGKTATMSFNENKVPGDYPKDVPIYSPAKVVMAQSNPDKNARQLLLESSDGADKIIAFYKSELENHGWKTEASVGAGALTMYTATKDQRELTVQITDSGNKRGVMQVMADKH